MFEILEKYNIEDIIYAPDYINIIIMLNNNHYEFVDWTDFSKEYYLTDKVLTHFSGKKLIIKPLQNYQTGLNSYKVLRNDFNEK